MDFVSSVPFDSITLIFTNGEASSSLLKASRALKIIRLAKLLSLLRLLRISRLLRFMQRWEDVSGDINVYTHNMCTVHRRRNP